jgi:CBS domain-containing protein
VIRTFLNIRSIHVLSGDGETVDRRRVRCPAEARDVVLEKCLACAESGGIVRDPGDRLEYASCGHAGAEAEARREEVAASDHTPVSAVMTADVFAVRADVSLDALTEILLERGIGGVPVVDEDCRPVGVVSKTDLVEQRFVAGDTSEAAARGWQASAGHYRLQAGPGVHAEPLPGESVDDVMTRTALTVPERTPLAEAAELMSRRGVHRVLVVSGDGTLAGILTSTDIMRWVARRTREARPPA